MSKSTRSVLHRIERIATSRIRDTEVAMQLASSRISPDRQTSPGPTLATVARLLVVASCLGFAASAFAGDKDPLFISLTTDNDYRSSLALHVGKRMLELGHPLTVFVNDRGILVMSRANAARYLEQQRMLADLARAGAMVVACPLCMKHFGINEADLVDGVRVGTPQLTGEALFRENTKTLTW